jgi:hypothetical protein
MEETTPTPVTTTSLDIFTILGSVVLKEPHPINPIGSSSYPSEADPKAFKYRFLSFPQAFGGNDGVFGLLGHSAPSPVDPK